MNCSDFIDLIYLREQELDSKQLSKMKRHFSKCPACSTRYAQHETVRQTAEQLLRRTPELSDPLLLTNMVIGRIENDSMEDHHSRTGSLFDLLSMYLARTRVRTIMIALLVLITGSFIAEYTSAYLAIRRYEEHINNSSRKEYVSASSLPGAQIEMAIEDLSKMISGIHSSIEISENWIVMNKASLQRFLHLYNELKENSSELPPDFYTANPELSKLLASPKRSIPPNERETLLRELNMLLPKERNIR